MKKMLTWWRHFSGQSFEKISIQGGNLTFVPSPSHAKKCFEYF